MDTGYGRWGLAAIMIVVASWILYRYAAPRRWRDWSGAGLVQAFVIALYAEMYGFPLTLYVLTGVLGLDIPILHVKGHLWATLLGYGYIGSLVEMAVGYAFIVLGILILARAWRELYAAHRQGRPATTGLYGVVRHPQYTGIFIALFGQLVHWPTIATVVLFPLIVIAYVRLARREEREMVERFGELYTTYRRVMPAFFPRGFRIGRLVRALGGAQ